MPKTKRELDRDIKEVLSRRSASPRKLTAAYLNSLVASSVHPEPLDWRPLAGHPEWMQADFDTDKYLLPYTIGGRIEDLDKSLQYSVTGRMNRPHQKAYAGTIFVGPK